MNLAEDTVKELLLTKNEFEFASIIFKNKITEEEWRNNRVINKHYKSIHSETVKHMERLDESVIKKIPRKKNN